MMLCGVDEAGRGSMLGPLVIAGIAIEKKDAKKLRALGVRDSKRLSPEKRAKLYPKIRRLAEQCRVFRVGPRTIDRSVASHNLNSLEARYMARIISKVGAEVSYVDSCDVNSARFGRAVSSMSGCKVRSYHRADDRFVVVAAASIIAKVVRDKEIAKLGKREKVGSGYPSDKRSVRFVRSCIKDAGSPPACARASWRPVRRLAGLP